MAGISSSALNFGQPDNKKLFNGNELQNKEFSDLSGLEWTDFNARSYDQQTGRFLQVDPLPEDGDQESFTPYQFGLDNPARYNDPDGKCPNCLTALIGAGIGAVVGAVVEGGSQLYNSGKITSWSAVGGATVQGAVTGGVAGFTGGSSLLVTAAASAGANVVGGAANNVIQGKEVTAGSVVKDAAIGVVTGAGGKLLDKGINASVAKATGKEIGILKDASTGKGNFGLGEASEKTSNKLGQAWVGDGAKTASDGKTLISSDGLRQYRPPSQKASSYATTGTQSNFESRNIPKGQWQSNGHLNVQSSTWQKIKNLFTGN